MKDAILQLIKTASTTLPGDVADALKKAHAKERKGSNAKAVLSDILTNIEIARQDSIPLCQDTGTINLFITHPKEIAQSFIKGEVNKAVKAAVKKGYLLQNAVDPVTGTNTGTGIGDGNPSIHFTQSRAKSVRIDLLLKGGGSENVSAQYSLPDSGLKAYRDLDGVKRCVIDAVFRAQGRGCAPGIIGIGIGGDRASSYNIAKKQLLRKLDDVNEDAALMKLENDLMAKLNTLCIGPMGVGGKTTVLSVKAGALARVPASFFVSVAYICWALRRASCVVRG